MKPAQLEHPRPSRSRRHKNPALLEHPQPGRSRRHKNPLPSSQVLRRRRPLPRVLIPGCDTRLFSRPGFPNIAWQALL